MLKVLAVVCAALCVAMLSAEAAPAGLFHRPTPYSNHGGFAEMQRQQDEAAKLFTNLFSTVLSAINKRIENGEIQSDNDFAKTLFGVVSNLLSAAGNQVDPNNQFARTLLKGFQGLVSKFGNNFGETQSNELPKAVLGLFGDLSSAISKKADPNDKIAQTFFNVFNGILSHARNSLGDGLQEEANVEYLLGTPINGFGRNEEAEEQFWGSVLRGALSGAARDVFRRAG